MLVVESHVIGNETQIEYVGGTLQLRPFQLSIDMNSSIDRVTVNDSIIIPAVKSLGLVHDEQRYIYVPQSLELVVA